MKRARWLRGLVAGPLLLLLLPLAGPLFEDELVLLELLNDQTGVDQLLLETVAVVSIQCLPHLGSIQLLPESDDLRGVNTVSLDNNCGRLRDSIHQLLHLLCKLVDLLPAGPVSTLQGSVLVGQLLKCVVMEIVRRLQLLAGHELGLVELRGCSGLGRLQLLVPILSQR